MRPRRELTPARLEKELADLEGQAAELTAMWRAEKKLFNGAEDQGGSRSSPGRAEQRLVAP